MFLFPSDKMSVLLKEIQTYDSSAARVLQGADFCTDSEIQTLTREDLHELFPGSKQLKLRRKIFEIINKQKPIEKLLKDIRGFLPDDSIKDALNSNGVLVDYLHLLKDMKAQLNNVQSFLEAHIHLLEDIKGQPQQSHDAGDRKLEDKKLMFHLNKFPNGPPAEALAGPTGSIFAANDTTSQKSQVTVNYSMVISGQTFEAHRQILSQVNSSAQQLNLVESQGSDDCQIVLVFCPIVSRMGTDVEAAMTMVTGTKPVILILMHHAHEPKHVGRMETWDCKPKIVQHFSVFYHESVNGLIKCKENNDAISGIQRELLKLRVPTETREYSVSPKKGSGLFGIFYPR